MTLIGPTVMPLLGLSGPSLPTLPISLVLVGEDGEE